MNASAKSGVAADGRFGGGDVALVRENTPRWRVVQDPGIKPETLKSLGIRVLGHVA